MYYVTSLRDDTYSSKAALEILRMWDFRVFW